MAIYRPAKNSKVWWYEFIFEGQRVRESAKTHSKTLARDAERARRRELEESYNGIKRRDRAKLFSIAADEWLVLKSLTLAASSQRIERDNLKHLRPKFEKRLVTDIQAKDVSCYQHARLAEGAAPKTINLEVGTLRAILRRHRVWAEIQQDIRMLPASDDVGHSITPEEECALVAACLQSRSRCLYVAVMLALNTGMRYSEIRLLSWRQVDFADRILSVGKSKSTAGTGRAIPLNARVRGVLEMWAAQVPGRQPAHFVFPHEKYGAAGREERFGFAAGSVVYDTDPTRPIGNWKEAWEKAKARAGAILAGNAERLDSVPLPCRFHDLRHTAVTRLLEAGIPYPVVASIMGWSAATAIRMAKRYGHIGNQALRAAADVLGETKLGAVKFAPPSLKKSPKSGEVQNVAVQ
jgi:integrase